MILVGRIEGALVLGLAAVIAGGAPAPAQDATELEPAVLLQEVPEDEDHHLGYYYPKPQTIENYVSPLFALPESDKTRRQAFIIGMTRQMMGGQYAPSFTMFAKGQDSDKLIIVALVDGQLNTLYRARAVLATFTSVARATQFFRNNAQAEDATFLDLLKLLGYRRVTTTDGRDFAHQITIN